MPRNKGEMKGQTEYQGVYKGRVEVAVDPLNLGRMKVRIPSFHGMPSGAGSIPNDDLPWASYCSPSGAGNDHGSFIPAEKGDYVWVAFEGGDPDKPVVLGGSFGTGATKGKDYGEKQYKFTGGSGVNEIPTEAQAETEPNTKVIYKSPKGATILIDEKNGAENIKIIDRIGQSIEIKGTPSAPPQPMTRRRTMLWSNKSGIDGTGSIEIYDVNHQRITMKKSGIELMGPDDEFGIKIANGTITVIGKLHVTEETTTDAKITAGGDVIAESISLQNHTHAGVHGETSKSH